MKKCLLIIFTLLFFLPLKPVEPNSLWNGVLQGFITGLVVGGGGMMLINLLEKKSQEAEKKQKVLSSPPEEKWGKGFLFTEQKAREAGLID